MSNNQKGYMFTFMKKVTFKLMEYLLSPGLRYKWNT